MLIHSWLSSKCAVLTSPSQGAGVFAMAPISLGELVAVWGGKVYTTSEIADLAVIHPNFDTHTVSVAPGFHLGPVAPGAEIDDAECFNHSCQPNLGVQGQIVLVARRAINTGEELTFDYDTTETTAAPFECRCGSLDCRGVIDGSRWKDPAFRKWHSGYLSWNVMEAVRQDSGQRG